MSEPNSHDGVVLMLSGDLMFASRVRAAAERGGLEFQLGGSLPDGDLHSMRYVILDLSTRSKLAGELAADCKSRCPRAKLIAYGPHVQVDKLELARQSGIETVMTNGQFDRQLVNLFR